MTPAELQSSIEAYLEGRLPGEARQKLEALLRKDEKAAEAFARLQDDEEALPELMSGRWQQCLDLLFEPGHPRRLWLMSLIATASIIGSLAPLGRAPAGESRSDAAPGPGAG